MNDLLDALAKQWLFDIEVLSQWWILLPVFPALLYASFMMVKWLVITCPIWMPIAIVFTVLAKDDE